MRHDQALQEVVSRLSSLPIYIGSSPQLNLKRRVLRDRTSYVAVPRSAVDTLLYLAILG